MIKVTSNQSPRLPYPDLEKLDSFQCADKKCNKFPRGGGADAITFYFNAVLYWVLPHPRERPRP